MHWLFAVGILVSLLVVSAIIFSNKPPEGPNRFGSNAPSVGFVSAVQGFFSNYFNFTGRASRSEFWYAMLFYVVACFALGFLNVPDILVSIFLLGTLIPFFSVTARRLHDTNRSGWFQLVSWFAPVGTIIAIFWFSEPPRD
ncbi:DUF805 domain-containing protein [Aquamicrobium sp. LC103]|uniref:DUF805 domain-containing protein n=1 Tax=Aquamicrobium sp. LC103 TaxID=1120658 RepID=UPI0009E57494|nr:DUF805 domain-containing protein [Aquamicrobium sp. LC103]TKT82478.1 DUF805 domain-containing protein [Aquamicrobium sp. LC103]